jgi:hypothetical protein
MTMRFLILILASLVLFISSCGTVMPGKTKTNATTSSYSEDLTPYRPEPYVGVEPPADTTTITTFNDSTIVDVSEKLNIVLDTAAIYARATIKYIDGFTIQVYGGDDRARARDYRINLIRNFPSTEPKMVFEQPNYKVRVGSYQTRLEAQHLFTQVQQVFPKAILIPARIYLK